MPADGGRAARVRCDAIRVHPLNVRSHLGDLRGLTASVRRQGIIVPLRVHHKYAKTAGNPHLELLHGHRRLAAAELAGLSHVPVVIVRTHSDGEAILSMLVENVGRVALAPADRARAIKTLRRHEYSLQAIAESLGTSESQVRAWQSGAGAELTAPDGQLPPPDDTPPAPVPPRHTPALQRARVRKPPGSGPPRIAPTRLHEVCDRWVGKAPPALLAELRDLLNGWTPNR